VNRKFRKILEAVETGDTLLLGSMSLLVFLGIIVVYGAGSYNNPGGGSVLGQHFLIAKHLFMIAVGFVSMMVLANINFKLLRKKKLNWSALVLGLILVAMTLKQGENGVINRWVNIGGFRFQPVELTKLAVIFFMAERWAPHAEAGRLNWKTVWPGVVFGPLPLFYFLYEQPNFGNILTMGAVIVVGLLVAGFAWKNLAIILSTGAAAAVLAFLTSSKLETRLGQWWKGASGGSYGYQVEQSLMGMGAGGVTGLGPGNGHNKFAFLPEAHTDFIYSVTGEELGLFGSLTVILLLMIFIWRGYSIAGRASDAFGRIIAASLTTSLAVYGIVNIAMVTGVFPVVGVPLPFVSFGGTAMVAALASVGILLNIDHTSRMINMSRQRAKDRTRI